MEYLNEHFVYMVLMAFSLFVFVLYFPFWSSSHHEILKIFLGDPCQLFVCLEK